MNKQQFLFWLRNRSEGKFDPEAQKFIDQHIKKVEGMSVKQFDRHERGLREAIRENRNNPFMLKIVLRRLSS